MGVLTWWSDETLCLANAETHAAVENLREEVRQRIRDSRQATEAHGKTPDLEIKTRFQELDKVEGLGGDIGSVGINASHDEVHLAFVEKAPCLLGVGIRERHKETVTHDTDEDSEDSFNDEDPAAGSCQHGLPERCNGFNNLKLTAIPPFHPNRPFALARTRGYR